MAVTPVHTTLTVTTAGTRVQATTDADYKPSSIYFEALGTNTGFIYIGLVTVSSTVYIARLAAGASFSFSSDDEGSSRSGGSGIQLSSLYVDSSVNGEKIQMTYQYRQG
jgi:hypothetical protein